MATAGRRVGQGETSAIRLLTALVLVAATLRVVGAVLYGIRTATQSFDAFGFGSNRSGQVLTAFGSAGDIQQALLVLVASVLVGGALRTRRQVSEGLRFAALAVDVLTVVSALLTAVGYVVVFHSNFNQTWGQLARSEAESAAVVVLAGGALALVNGFERATARAGKGDDGFDAVVFALDRHSIDVRAFFSLDEVRRRLHVYSVEENEYELFSDEGEELRVALDSEGRMSFAQTGIQRKADLLERLKEFALRRGISVDPADADDPSAYAIPVSNWQWLELWPPWMRPIGRIFRRT